MNIEESERRQFERISSKVDFETKTEIFKILEALLFEIKNLKCRIEELELQNRT